MNEEIFEEMIAEVKDVFKDWRYVYEIANESARPGTLYFLCMSLRKVTSELYEGLL